MTAAAAATGRSTLHPHYLRNQKYCEHTRVSYMENIAHYATRTAMNVAYVPLSYDRNSTLEHALVVVADKVADTSGQNQSQTAMSGDNSTVWSTSHTPQERNASTTHKLERGHMQIRMHLQPSAACWSIETNLLTRSVGNICNKSCRHPQWRCKREVRGGFDMG